MSNPFIPLSQKRLPFNVSGTTVFVCMPCHRDINPELMICLFRTMNACREVGIDLIWWEENGSSMVHAARSKAAYYFLTNQDKADFLFWIDSDIKWEPGDFVRLVAFAKTRKVVGAAYPMKIPNRIQFAINGDPGSTIETDEFGLISTIKGIGMGFSCIAREVIEALAAKAPRLIFPDVGDEPIPHIFRVGETEDGKFLGEDMAFFEDCAAAGYPLFVDPVVKLGHIGTYIYEGRFSDLLKKMDGVLSKPAASSAA